MGLLSPTPSSNGGEDESAARSPKVNGSVPEDTVADLLLRFPFYRGVISRADQTVVSLKLGWVEQVGVGEHAELVEL